MKSLKIYQLFFIRLLLIMTAAGIGIYSLALGLPYTAFFCLLVTVLLLAELFSFIKNTYLFYDKVLSAILNNDFSADFSRHSNFDNYKNLLRLYDTLKERQNEQATKDLVYRTILNTIETSVLILNKNGDEWAIFLMNDHFSDHFSTPKVSKWKYLQNQLPALCNIIEERDFRDLRTSVQISLGGGESQTYMLQTSRSTTFGQEYYIVMLDSIQKVVAKKEKDAWINLMKVISHELMNSITPIRSLTQNMNELVAQDTLSREDMEDIRESVHTMIHRSDHLQSFIESYRKLAMLPSPDKKRVELKSLLDSSLAVMAPIFKKAGITVNNDATQNRWIMADARQMEQALINLLTNSMYALEGSDRKEITIAAEVKNNRTFVTISDTGLGIDKEIEDKIFLPFFTTRPDGAGIGLTLSKNIIEAHGGYLSFKNEGSGATFIISLL
ncbi:sensor histidine kinase [Flavobacterium sp.]|uniref:sensor histidine kinase n=1 Tax=Flavobacterium sp. TaxID=239 RepID=UPI004033DFF5